MEGGRKRMLHLRRWRKGLTGRRNLFMVRKASKNYKNTS
jgi:hypothetical protein